MLQAAERTHERRAPTTTPVLVLSAGVLLVHSALVAVQVSDAATLIANLAMVAVALAWALRRGLHGDDLGLDRSAAGRSARVGGLLAAGIVAVVALLAAIGALPADPEVAGLDGGRVAFRLLVAIPIGTAIGEELLFRGVLLAAWDRVLPPGRSAAVVSALFGLWHVVAEWQRTGGVALVGGVVATAAVSLFVLCPLRRRTGSVVAPIVVHAATNTSVLAAIWWLAR